MAVLQAAAFHILSADIKDEIDIRAKMGSGLIMGYRFYFTKVDVQGFF